MDRACVEGSGMTNAAMLRHLAAHPYRDEIVALLKREAFRRPGVAWRWTLLDLALELESKP
jgi:hypothetical protein